VGEPSYNSSQSDDIVESASALAGEDLLKSEHSAETSDASQSSESEEPLEAEESESAKLKSAE